MQCGRVLLALKACALAASLLVVFAVAAADSANATAGNSIALLGTDGYGGRFSSLVLGQSGNPVISDYHISDGLRVLHCNDANCQGDDEIISAPHNDGSFGKYTSLVLDASGYPVVSYYDYTSDDLMLLHCNDPYCLGDDESIESPDTAGDVGKWTSLVLDASGNPIVAYYDATNWGLKVLHCNDPNCEGEGDIIASPDTVGDVWLFASMTLDASGNPVVAYAAQADFYEVRVLHCGDPTCTSGNSIDSPIDVGIPAGHCSLTLDPSGNPVVSYSDVLGDRLRILHCSDPNCAGGDESITSPDPDSGGGWDTSIELDTSGHPVVSYTDYLGDYVKVMHCNDADCTGNDESVVYADVANTYGNYSSLALDSFGDPVVSYYSGPPNGNLRLLHCGGPNCAGKPVGGIAEVPHTDAAPLEAGGPSGPGAGVIAAAVAAGAIPLGCAAWYVRRRRA